MKTWLLAGCVLVAPLVYAATPKKQPAMSDDMQRAIAFERYKDLAAARQARKEAIHPSVTYSNRDRSVEEPEQGKAVKDAGPVKKDK
jgi:hypothetical protein